MTHKDPQQALTRDTASVIGPTLALLTALIFATSSIAAKIATFELEALTIILVRSSIAAVVLLAVMLFQARSVFRISIRDIPAIAVLGVVGIVATLWFLLQALTYTTVTSTALIGATAPIVTAVSAAIVFKERLPRAAYLGVVTSFAGVILLITDGRIADLRELSFNRGDLLMFGNVVSSAIYALTIKSLSVKYASLTLTFYMTIAAILALLILVDFDQVREVSSASATSIWALLYLGIVTSAIGYFLYNYTVKIVGPTVMSCTVFSAMPVFVMILAWVMLGKVIASFEVISSALISVGLFFVLRPNSRA
ncbi:DMT family transporter [uncultured Tateyamaria sp.]|uniref:DMT family transporter n=1 Tax=uncultured Tateyamaria sp. TaxID=455651 RepID=UPI002610CF1E|nr:DMT family transporter [uncultured Tateyamaria sp.]